jgi:uncharacterized protein with von Willebrand factor type A (vWA) domain
LLYNENATADRSLASANREHPESAVWGTMVRELFADGYGIGNEAVTTEHEHKTWANDLLARVRNLPEWQEAIRATEGDDLAAARLAGKVADAIARIVTPPDVSTPPKPRRRKVPDGKGGNRKQTDEEMETEARQVESDREGDFQTSAKRAVSDAKQEQKAIDESADSVGKMAGSGTELGVKAKRDVRRALAGGDVARLARIAKLAGRMREVARKAHSRKAHGPGAIESITRGGELMRLLPSEMMKLPDSTLGPVLWANIQDDAAMQFDVQAVVNGKGPIVFCLDKSFSMEGECDEFAIASALSLMETARKEKRAFALIEYQGSVTHSWMFRNPGKPEADQMAGIMARGVGGGTRVSAALERAREMIAKEKAFKHADVIVLTDGYDMVDWAEEKKAFDAMRVSMHFVGIGQPCPAPSAFASSCSISAIEIHTGQVDSLTTGNNV